MGYEEMKPARLGRKDRIATIWFVVPILIVFTVLTAIPLVRSMYWSLTDYNVYRAETTFVGLENYRTIFADATMLSGMGFTLLFALTTTAGITLLAIPLAVQLNKPFFGRDISRALFFFLGVPSLAILGLVWRYIFSPLGSGVINSVLVTLGLERMPWLSDPGLARFAVVFVAIWAGVGWHATLYLAYLQAIPKDLYEQATVDGAGPGRQFIHITLPQLVPGVTVSTFLLITGGLKVYDLPYALTGGGPGYATNTITQSIITHGIAQADYGVGSALAVLFTLATMLIIMLQVAVANIAQRRF